MFCRNWAAWRASVANTNTVVEPGNAGPFVKSPSLYLLRQEVDASHHEPSLERHDGEKSRASLIPLNASERQSNAAIVMIMSI